MEVLIKFGVQIAPQIFRRIVQIERRRADARQVRFVQYGGKDASKMCAQFNQRFHYIIDLADLQAIMLKMS